MQYPPIRKLKTISKNESRLFNCVFAIAVGVSLFVFADDLLNGRQLVGFADNDYAPIVIDKVDILQ